MHRSDSGLRMFNYGGGCTTYCSTREFIVSRESSSVLFSSTSSGLIDKNADYLILPLWHTLKRDQLYTESISISNEKMRQIIV